MDEASGPPLDVWPENLTAYNVFVMMMTQWHRAGMNGVCVGLMYGELPLMWELCGVSKKERKEVFDALRVMEDAALAFFQFQREQEAKKGK